MTSTARAEAVVFAFTLNGDGSANDLSKSAPLIGDRPTWLHGDLSKPDCLDWLESLSVPETIIESMMRTDTRPRSLSSQQGTLLILRALNMNPGSDPEDMVSLRLWIEKNRLVTLRQRQITSVQDVKQDLLNGKAPADIDYLVLSLIEKMADRVAEFINGLEDQIDAFEENLDILEPTKARSEIAGLRRQSAIVRRYLAPQREALENFHRQTVTHQEESYKYFIREVSDRMVRYVEDLDLFRERTQVLLEELLNRVAQTQNARMYVLSIVAAIFLPISFVTGLFGMNVGGLPWMDTTLGFIFVSGIMAVISTGIIVYFMTRKWL